MKTTKLLSMFFLVSLIAMITIVNPKLYMIFILSLAIGFGIIFYYKIKKDYKDELRKRGKNKMNKIKVNGKEFELNSPNVHPEEWLEVLAIIDCKKSGGEYRWIYEEQIPSYEHVLGIVHFWNGCWEDEDSQQVTIVGWVEVKI